MKHLLIIILLHVMLLSNTISLTNKEKEWIEKHQKITVAFEYNFAPFEYIDETNNIHGISADYLKELTQLIGVNFEIIKERSWPLMNEMAKDGKVDIFTCIVPTKQRASYLNFTKPYISFPMVIVTNKNTGFINDLKELNNKTVAVIDNYTPHQILEKNYPKVHLVKTKDLNQALELVATGKTFAHVGNLSRVMHLLRDKGFQNLSITGITKYKYDFSIGIKKDDPILNNIIQKAFNAIPKQTHDKIYNKWFPVNYQKATDNTSTIYIITTVLIIFLLIFAWSIHLKKEIKRRKLIENQLKKNVNWLNSSLKKADIGAWNWDLRTNIITGNSVYASILGLKDKEIMISAKDFQKNFIHPDDLSLVIKELEDYFSGKIKNCSAKFRIFTKDEKIKTIESKGEIFQYDAFNNPSVLFGFIIEVKD